MRRELFSTAIATVLLMPALAVAQTSNTERPPQADMEGEQATEAPQGGASTAAPAQAPDSESAAGPADTVPQQGATGTDAQTATDADAGLTAEGLEGADVIDAAGEAVGTVDTIALAEAGTVEGVLVDVGGFLGIGTRSVMLTTDQFEVERDPESAEVTLTTNLTREEIKELPEHED